MEMGEDGRTTEQENNPGAQRATAGVAGVSGTYAESGAVHPLPGSEASARGLPGVRVLPGASGDDLTRTAHEAGRAFRVRRREG